MLGSFPPGALTLAGGPEEADTTFVTPTEQGHVNPRTRLEGLVSRDAADDRLLILRR